MKIIALRFVLTLLCLNLNMLFGTLAEKPKIFDLLPGLVDVPAIEPAIPNDFVVMSPIDKPNIAEGIYWGKKQDLQAYFEDENSIANAIIRVSFFVKQDGPDHFKDEEKIPKLFPDMLVRKLKWGRYPVLAAKCLNEDKKMIHFAVIGLNSPDGNTLIFDLIYPENSYEKTLELWNNFINSTQELSTQKMLLLKGLDMQEGFTIASVNGSTIKFSAEKRKKDDKLRIAMFPLEGKTSFKLKDVLTGPMGLDWKQGEPLAKVYGIITEEGPYGTVVQEQATPIFIQTVNEFSAIDKNLIIYTE